METESKRMRLWEQMVSQYDCTSSKPRINFCKSFTIPRSYSKYSYFDRTWRAKRHLLVGISSIVRKSINPDETTCVRDSGMDVTRVNLPEAVVRSDPETSVFMDQIGLWVGPSTTLAIVPFRRGARTLQNFGC